MAISVSDAIVASVDIDRVTLQLHSRVIEQGSPVTCDRGTSADVQCCDAPARASVLVEANRSQDGFAWSLIPWRRGSLSKHFTVWRMPTANGTATEKFGTRPRSFELSNTAEFALSPHKVPTCCGSAAMMTSDRTCRRSGSTPAAARDAGRPERPDLEDAVQDPPAVDTHRPRHWTRW